MSSRSSSRARRCARFSRGTGSRLPRRKTIDYSLQIVRGLAAAHEKGIVHRDLKPENVFVTNDGRVKILDFGLARIVAAGGGLARDEHADRSRHCRDRARDGARHARVHVPEQVRGKPADARSDIFSFGAILYEMLSGKRAFHGDSAADTMSAILKEEPPDLSISDENISPGLDRIVRHCLEKNPEQRFHSAHDVAFDLEALSGLSTPRGEPSKAKAGFDLPSRLPSRWAAAALLAALAIGLAAGRLIWKTPPAVPTDVPQADVPPRTGPERALRPRREHGRLFGAMGRGRQSAALLDARREPRIVAPAARRGKSPGDLAHGRDARVELAARRGGLRRDRHPLAGAPVGQRLAADPRGRRRRRLVPRRRDARLVVRAPQWRYRLEYPAGRFSTKRPATSAIRASLPGETPSRFSTTRSWATTAARSRSWISRERRRRCPTDGKACRAWPGPRPAGRSGSPRPAPAAPAPSTP